MDPVLTAHRHVSDVSSKRAYIFTQEQLQEAICGYLDWDSVGSRTRCVCQRLAADTGCDPTMYLTILLSVVSVLLGPEAQVEVVTETTKSQKIVEVWHALVSPFPPHLTADFPLCVL